MPRLAGFALLAFLAVGLPQAARAAGYTYATVASAFGFFAIPSINDKGFVAFTDFVECQAGEYCPALFTTYPSGTAQAVVTGSPGGEFAEATINQVGAVTFVSGFPTGSLDRWQNGAVKHISSPQSLLLLGYAFPRILSNGTALYADGFSLKSLLLAANGTSKTEAPGYCPAIFGGSASLNGTFVFPGMPYGTHCNEPATGLYLGNVHTGALALRLSANGPYGQIGYTAVNNKRQIAFSSFYLPNHPTPHVNGLFVVDALGSVRELAEIDNGACPPQRPTDGTACPYRNFGYVAIAPKGQVVAEVATTDWGNPTPQNVTYSIALNGDLEHGLIAGPGMTIGDCNVHFAMIEDRAVNRKGQVAFMALCTDAGGNYDHYAVIVATPMATK